MDTDSHTELAVSVFSSVHGQSVLLHITEVAMTDGWLKLVFVKEILVSSNLNEKLISELHGEVKPIETSYGSDQREWIRPN